MSTSNNVVFFFLRNRQGMVVGTFRQNILCKPHYADLLKYQPLTAHTIQERAEDYEHKAPEQFDLYEFLVKTHVINDLTSRRPEPELVVPELPDPQLGMIDALIERVIANDGEGIVPHEVCALVEYIVELEHKLSVVNPLLES